MVGTRSVCPSPIDPFWFSANLAEFVLAVAVVVLEALTQRPAIVNVIASKDRLSIAVNLLMASGFSGAPGLALVANFAEPDRPFVALEDDGSYSFAPVNCVVSAAPKYGLPILAVVFTNGGNQAHNRTQHGSSSDDAVVRTVTYVGTQFDANSNDAQQIVSWNGVGRKIYVPDAGEPALEAGFDAIADRQLGLVDADEDDSVLEIEPPT